MSQPCDRGAIGTGVRSDRPASVNTDHNGSRIAVSKRNTLTESACQHMLVQADVHEWSAPVNNPVRGVGSGLRMRR